MVLFCMFLTAVTARFGADDTCVYSDITRDNKHCLYKVHTDLFDQLLISDNISILQIASLDR